MKVLDSPSIDVTVVTADFRAAVQAVAPHATPDPDWHRFHRLRAYVGTDAVTLVAATNISFGIASVKVEEHISAELGCFDLLPSDARELSRLFKPSKDEAEYAKLNFQVVGKELVTTDVGGFFPGKSLTLNALPVDERFPDVAQVLRKADARSAFYQAPEGFRTLAQGKLVRAFTEAAAAYGYPLSIQPTGKSAVLIVHCGESFVGALMPLRQDEYTDEHHAERRAKWWDRLADVTRSHPFHPDQKVADPDAELTVILLGSSDDRPVKGMKAVAEVDDDQDLDDDPADDEEPAEVESVPMFDDERPVEDVHLPDVPEVFADSAATVTDRAVRAITAMVDERWETTSNVELKQLLNVGHAKAAQVMSMLIKAGAVEGGELNRPRRVLVDVELSLADVIAALRESR